MKKIQFLFALLLAVSAQAQEFTKVQQVKYTVKGVSKENGKMVYLEDKLTSKVVDSVVVAKWKFSFKGQADKDAIFGITFDKDNWQSWRTLFFNDGKTISVNMNDSTLKGSHQNERMAKYDIELDRPTRAFLEKTSKMSEAEMIEHREELMDEYNKLLDGQLALANKVFAEERQTLIPLNYAELYFFDNGVGAYDKLVEEQLPLSSHPYLKKARDEVAAMLQPKNSPKTAFIGQQFTDLEMSDPDGKMHKISELVGPGKWALVDFWASWCGPCRAEMPNVVEAYNKFHAKGFEVVGISFDQKREAWVNAIAQLKMPWLQLSDLKGWQCAAAPVYKIDAIPDNILIDPQGKIADRALRGKALQHRLQSIFGE